MPEEPLPESYPGEAQGLPPPRNGAPVAQPEQQPITIAGQQLPGERAALPQPAQPAGEGMAVDQAQQGPLIQDYTWLDKVYQAAKQIPDPRDQQYFLDKTIRAIRNDVAINAAAERQQRLAIQGTIDKILLQPDPQTGTGARSPEEALKRNPNFNLIIEQARRYDPRIDLYVDGLFKKNIANDNIETPERRTQYMALYGESKSDPQKFIDEDLTKYNLTAKRFDELTKKKADLRAKAEDNTHLHAALQTLSSTLAPLGIFQSRTDLTANQNFNIVAGYLSAAMDDLKAQGKPVPHWSDFQGLEKLAAPIIRQTPGVWFPTKPDEHFFTQSAWQIPPGTNPGERDWLVTQFKRYNPDRGEPSDRDLGAMYWNYLQHRGTRAGAGP